MKPLVTDNSVLGYLGRPGLTPRIVRVVLLGVVLAALVIPLGLGQGAIPCILLIAALVALDIVRLVWQARPRS